MPSTQPDSADQPELRQELLKLTEEAIERVRELVSQLNELEKEYMTEHSSSYRRMVDAVRRWYSHG